MELVDLIVAIVVVTILVTVVVGLATYVAYKLRLARQPGGSGGGGEEGTRYFFLHEPPEEGEEEEEGVDGIGPAQEAATGDGDGRPGGRTVADADGPDGEDAADGGGR